LARSKGADEGEPLGKRFQGVHRLVDAVGVFRAEPAVSNQCQVNPTQPGQLPIKQHGRPHLDVA